MRHACCLDNLDRCWCWGDMICLGISWNDVTAVGWAQLVTPRQSMACQELRADNDELRRQNAELEAKDWGSIGMPSGCHRMRFPLFPTGFLMPVDPVDDYATAWYHHDSRKKRDGLSSGQASARLRASHSNSKSFKQSRKSRMDDIMWRSPPKSATQC